MGTLRGWREYMAPTRQTTAFLEKGVLTPDEFVRAGDELVFRCPAWSWAASSTSKGVSHLPADKQYLITKHVPCPTRVSELEAQLGLLQQEEANGGDDDDWLVSTIVKQQQQPKQSSLEDEFDILDQEGEIVEKQVVVEQQTDGKKGEEEEEEYADMANFEDEDVLIDDDNAAAAVAAANNDDDDNLLAVRTYDLSITYDKYYQTPRVWMVGHSSTGQPLTGAEMLQDVMPDYANKTVTIEAHPHVSGPHASIHPCKHGKVMKTIVRNLMAHAEDGEEEKAPSVEMYLFIFLKFVSSIIPTINYDFTMDVEMRTQVRV